MSLRPAWTLVPLALILGASLGLARTGHTQQPERPPAGAPVRVEPNALAFRILLGRGDTAPTDWSGSLSVSGGRLLQLSGWRFRQNDELTGPGSWRAMSRRQQQNAAAARRQNQPQNMNPGNPGEGGAGGAGQGGGMGRRRRQGMGMGARQAAAQAAGGAMTATGVVATVLPERELTVSVRTPKGEFSFTPDQVPYGGAPVRFLGGAAIVERVIGAFPVAVQPTENDFPAAAAAPDGSVWVAYTAYRFGAGETPNLRAFQKEPESFEFLRPKGNGDQVRLAKLSGGGWSEVANLSEAGVDAYRPGIGVDGKGNVWAVWSENVKGNWDLYARVWRNGQLSPAQRLTTDPGTDLHPVLARDDKGALWLAWQGFRGEQSDVFLASLSSGGDRWGRPERVSPSPRNDWDPQVACAGDGSVYVAWDTYDAGDYDVMLRRYAGGKAGDVIPVAATPRFEARAVVTCDAQNRAWIAWEEAPEGWGKDFGYVVRDNPPGTPLYRGHTVQVRCYADGRLQRPAGDLSTILPAAGQPAAPAAPAAPNANQSIGNQARASAAFQASFPRLGVDRSGRVTLTYRRTLPELRGPVGSCWLSYVTRYEGSEWKTPVLVPDSDGELDCRPALAQGSALFMILTSDGRNRSAGEDPRRGLVVAPLDPGDRAAGPAPALAAVDAQGPRQPDPKYVTEVADVTRIRTARPRVAGKTYRLMRGDWHRHTELSQDGGGDGPIIDVYRYALDAAGMDWMCAQDHDNGMGREYTWWQTQKLCDLYHVGDRVVPLFGYERSVRYPDGHRNVMFSYRGVRPLPRLNGGQGNGVSPDDTKMLYKYLRFFDGICSSHTSATDMGTDWRDNDPKLEPVVEIYQGDRNNYEYEGAPRANSPGDSPGGYQPAGFVWNAFAKGYRLGFQSASDHISTHMSYGVAFVEKPTREAILDAFKKRHTYGATDNIVLVVRSGEHLMGDEFESAKAPELQVHVEGTGPIARLIVVRDNKVVYTAKTDNTKVDLTWIDNEAKAGTSYYYVRVEQADGQLAWASPMWITYRP